jgi:hypothetical protein
VSGSIVASSEMASDDRLGALLISSVNSATDAGAKCASEGKGPASGTSGVCGACRTAGGRSRCAHSKTRFRDCAGKVEAVVVADAGCRGANPNAQLQDRIGAAFLRRRSAPPLGAVA